MNVTPSSNTVTWCGPCCEARRTNIYGCTPCPWCGSHKRAAYKKTNTIDCDDCGFTVPTAFASEAEYQGECCNEHVR